MPIGNGLPPIRTLFCKGNSNVRLPQRLAIDLHSRLVLGAVQRYNRFGSVLDSSIALFPPCVLPCWKKILESARGLERVRCFGSSNAIVMKAHRQMPYWIGVLKHEGSRQMRLEDCGSASQRINALLIRGRLRPTKTGNGLNVLTRRLPWKAPVDPRSAR